MDALTQYERVMPNSRLLIRKAAPRRGAQAGRTYAGIASPLAERGRQETSERRSPAAYLSRVAM
jgi:hypothetical protein